MKIGCDYFNSRRGKKYIEKEMFDKLDLSDCEVRGNAKIEISSKWIKWGKKYYPRALVAGVEYGGPGVTPFMVSDINQGWAELALLDGRTSKPIFFSTMAPGFHLSTVGNETDEYYIRLRGKIDPYVNKNVMSWCRNRDRYIKACKAIWSKHVTSVDDLLAIYEDTGRQSELIKAIIEEQTLAAIYYWWKITVERISFHSENDGKPYSFDDDAHSISNGTRTITIATSDGEIIIRETNKESVVREERIKGLRYTDASFGKRMDKLSDSFEIIKM